MECLVGVAFKDYVLIAADQTNSFSFIVTKDNENKLFKISKMITMAVAGESGDTTQFAEYISKNIQLYKMRNGYELTPAAAANFTRKNLATYLRSRTPYMVNLLLGGFDPVTGPELYFIDYLGSFSKLPYAAHGYGGHMCLGLIHRYYKEDLPLEEGYEILKKCVAEIHKRLIVNLPNFSVQVVDKDGIRDLEPITAKKLHAESLEL